MAFGIHKPGQGYWVRVLTASLAGLVLLAASAWAWKQTRLISIPITSWTVTTHGAGSVQAGDRLTVHGPVKPDGTRAELGAATAESATKVGESAWSLRIADVDLKEGSIGEGVALRGGAAFDGVVGNFVAEPMFERLYLQSGVVAVILIVGAILTFWLVASKPTTAEFLIATDGEMRKVNWSTRKGIIDSTWVVILWSLLLAAGIFVMDYFFAVFFRAIDLLQT